MRPINIIKSSENLQIFMMKNSVFKTSYDPVQVQIILKSQQPKIIQSFAKNRVQNNNAESSDTNDIQILNSLKNSARCENHIFQEDNFQIIQRPKSPKKSRNKKGQKLENLQLFLKKVGIKNDRSITNTSQLMSIPKNYQHVKQFSACQSISQNKNTILLPQIRRNHSKSGLFNKKIKTEGSNINSPKTNKNSNPKNKSLKSNKIKPSKSFSEKRLRQDYKFLFQKDDSQRYHQRSKPLLNEQKKKVNLLKIKQEMLGKIVLQRVQNHFRNKNDHSLSYITKIKQEKMIDEALVQFIKTKVKRADKILQ